MINLILISFDNFALITINKFTCTYAKSRSSSIIFLRISQLFKVFPFCNIQINSIDMHVTKSKHNKWLIEFGSKHRFFRKRGKM